MKWGRRKNPIKIQEEEDGIVDEPNTIKKTTSTFSLSNLLPWLSKLKHPNKPNNINHSPKPPTTPATAPAPAPTPAPTPKPLFSPPPLAPTRTHSDVAAPRRLSVGDDDSHLTRSRVRIHSLGSASDLDLLLLDPPRSRHHRRRRRSRRYSRPSVSETNPDMKPIKADPDADPDPDPIRSGRRSFSGGRVIRPRVRVYSPRLVNPNPIGKERGGGALERFAVVKSSSDPVRDFRESMVEMIWERGIGRRPEELESLLACYLSLNSDEHHDVIVKVFRQVWFDLNRQVDRVL